MCILLTIPYQNQISDGRLWWCPSGLFTYFPLHAAAPMDSNFIQSYTLTLESLIHANIKSTSPDAGDILTAIGVIEIPRLEALAPLPSVHQELNTVTAQFGGQTQQLLGSQATVENVLERMQSSAFLHLACHGEQNLDDALSSGLILYDAKLELGQILHVDLPKAKFVYLSACETAMGDAKLTNEAMHLAGGFIAAGFQGAIGTLWSMYDADGPIVAEIVYKTMLGEERVPDVRMAAKGLHLAIQKLRKDGAALHQWMPFVHIGI
jgi:CHAT domain-containing protein